jgi:hypothetical protein
MSLGINPKVDWLRSWTGAGSELMLWRALLDRQRNLVATDIPQHRDRLDHFLVI